MNDGEVVACPSCATSNPPGFRFCGACGASLLRVCPNCGNGVELRFRFCGNCGSSLDVTAAITSQRVAVEERKVVTVLFADLAASTELATRLDPEDLRDVLAAYFQEMSAQIVSHGGTVEKFIGDAVVGIFGAPSAHDDDPIRAVRAALAMHQRLPLINERVGAKVNGQLALRVAVHTGEVLAAPGAEHEGVVTGEATSLAARLQSVAPAGTVVVSQRTERDARTAFDFEPLGDFELKGAGTVPAWRLIGPRQSSVNADRPPLIGRVDELELMFVLLRRCIRERKSHLLTVVAPPGIGKTRLVTEFAERARSLFEGTAVVQGRCLAYGEGLTFWPLAEILKEDAGILDSDPAATMLSKTRDRIDSRFSYSDTPSSVTLTLLSSIGITVEADPLEGVGRTAADRLMTEAWATYLASRSGDGALVAVIEDIHWADAGLLDLLERLTSSLTAPILIVCLARAELYERRPTWGAARSNFASLDLSPLSSTEQRALIISQLEPASVDEELLDAIVTRVEGNPFFATELLHMLRDEGTIELRDDRWVRVNDLPSGLPDTVQATIAARLDRLGPSEKRLIQDAAVVGRVFWDGALERVGNGQTASLDVLIERGLVRALPATTIAGSREYAFQHQLICDVAYASIPRARRGEAHMAVIDWMETMTAGRDEEFAEVLAHHALLARDADRTTRYAALAGNRYRRIYASEEAIRWYDRALAPMSDLPPETVRLVVPEILAGRGETHELLGQLDAAAADYEREVEVARKTGRGYLEAHALAALTHVLWLKEDFARVRGLLQTALDSSRKEGTVDLEARLLYIAGSIAWAEGDWQGAIKHHLDVLAVAGATGDLEGEAYARQGLADTQSFSGPLDRALEEGLAARDLWARLGQRPRVHRSAQRLAYIYLLCSRFDEAAQSAEETLAGLRELNQRRDEPLTVAAQGLIGLFRGQLGEAEVALSEAVAAAEEQNVARAELMARVFRLLLAAELGLSLDRWSDLARATALSDGLEGFFGPVLVAAEGLRSALTGDIDTASQRFERARAGAADAIFYAVLVARFEVCAWEAGLDAAALTHVGQWLMARVGNQSPAHAELALYAQLRADRLRPAATERDGSAQRIADLLARARHTSDATVLWRLQTLADDPHGPTSVTRLLGSIGEDDIREAFARRVAALTQK